MVVFMSAQTQAIFYDTPGISLMVQTANSSVTKALILGKSSLSGGRRKFTYAWCRRISVNILICCLT